jgi:Phosphate-induced protein 1 conserved region
MKRTGFTLAVALLVVAGLLSASRLFTTAHAQSGERGKPEIIRHSLNENGNNGFALTTGTTRATTAIFYHNGPLINTPVAYVIWYGNWNQANGSDNAAGQQIVRDFLTNVGGSPYFLINTSYSAGGYNITGQVIKGTETTVGYPNGSSLGDATIQTIVNNAITSGSLPYDANGVYFVLTSSDVTESSGFCTNYCGWHTAGTPSAGHIRYSFVGNANRCLGSCAAQSTSPNGNAGVDGMISVIAHELEEATTDPDPRSGWADNRGQENADKCAWTFGHYQYQTANGSWANMHLGTRDYLIQRNLYHNLTGNGKDFCMMDATHN